MAGRSRSKRNQASSRNFGSFCLAQQAPLLDQEDRHDPSCSRGSTTNLTSRRCFGGNSGATCAATASRRSLLNPLTARSRRSGYGMTADRTPFSVAFPKLCNERPQQVGKIITPGMFTRRRRLQFPIFQQAKIVIVPCQNHDGRKL